MRGTYRTAGLVRSFSQLRRVQSFTFSRDATPFYRSPSSRRRLFRWSPRVNGTLGYGSGFKALRLNGLNGKKATRPCRLCYLHAGILARNPRSAHGRLGRPTLAPAREDALRVPKRVA